LQLLLVKQIEPGGSGVLVVVLLDVVLELLVVEEELVIVEDEVVVDEEVVVELAVIETQELAFSHLNNYPQQ
jgi:hypothetical protein